MASRGLTAGLLGVATVCVVAAAWAGVPPLLRRMDFFRVRRVEVAGLRYLSRDDLLGALRLPPGASVFDPLDPVRARLARVAGVGAVQVSRRLPGTIRIVVQEVEPVALVTGDKGMRLVAATGRLLPYDPAQSAPDLPVALSADSGLAALLDRVRDFDPALFAEVSTARREKSYAVLDVDGRRILLDTDASQGAIRSVTVVAQHLAKLGRSYTELDGRFSGQVIVRGMTEPGA